MDILSFIGALFAVLIPTSTVTLWILKLIVGKELAKFRTELIDQLDAKFMPVSEIRLEFQLDRSRLTTLENKG